MNKNINHFIADDYTDPAERRQAVINPSTGVALGSVALASDETVSRAIATAAKAYPAWRNTPPTKRAQVMFRLKQLLDERADEIAAVISIEHGKVLHDARGELQRGIENIEFACGIAQLLKGEHSKNVGSNIDSWSEFQALGVVAGITPFNFPAMVPLWMWPAAVMCGNTFILKPSEQNPSAALLIAQLAAEAGLPPGVLNVVNGDKQAVDALIRSDIVKAVSFVGSTPVAEAIYAKASAAGKRCQALGGAKNHAVVMPDADLPATVNGLMGAAYGSCGERCMAISVLVAVGDTVADALVELLRDKISAMKVGCATDNSNDMGPLINAAHRDRVLAAIDTAVAEGAELCADGRGLVVDAYENGYFVGATLFDRVTSQMDLYKTEVFGPVLAVVRVESLDAALRLINEHQYGNGTCIFTRDGRAARFFSDNVLVGMVGVNVPLPVPVAYHSFGGWKASIFGDLPAYGPDAIRFYTQRKTITQKWPAAEVHSDLSYSFPSY